MIEEVNILINIKKLVLLCLPLLLYGCAAAVTTQHDSPNTYGIDCSGKAVSIDACYQKAAKLCPSGYTVIKQEAPTQTNTVPILSLAGEIADAIPGVTKGITVQCKH